MCLNSCAVNKTALQRGEIIQEMLYEKCPVLLLKLPVLIQMEEYQMKNYLKIENSLLEWIYELTAIQSKSS